LLRQHSLHFVGQPLHLMEQRMTPKVFILLEPNKVMSRPRDSSGIVQVELAFYGSYILGIFRRSKSEHGVINAWREYHDHLNTKAGDDALRIWHINGDELFINLLFSMAKDVGYKFDRVQLKKGAYSPIAHGELEDQQKALRNLTIGVLSGELPLKMDVTSFPIHDEAIKSQLELQSKLSSALDHGALTVAVK